MEIVGALVGVVIGWILNESLSARLQTRRAKRDARFTLVREILRHRRAPSRGPVLNEVPLLFGDEDDVMRYWRELATPRTPRDQADLELLTKQSVIQEERMIAAMVKAVGLPALADGDLDNYIGIGEFSMPPTTPRAIDDGLSDSSQ